MNSNQFFCTGVLALAMMGILASASAQTQGDKASRLSLGGYGEAVMTRNFYSQSFNI